MQAGNKQWKQFAAVVTANKSRIQHADPAQEVRELVIEIEDAGFECEAGQSIGVLAPVPANGHETQHLRWYSIADLPAKDFHGRPNVTICVRRIVQKDPDHEDTVRGLASNFLCDAPPGTRLTVAGPSGVPFPLPPTEKGTLLLIGTGTGIAPFRSFIKTLYRTNPDWGGVIRLFYGRQNGLDVLYANDPQHDLAQYFDEETFKAFERFSPPPNWADPIAWDLAYSERGSELLQLLDEPDTYVYVAGLKEVGEKLDKLLAQLVGSANRWAQQKQELTHAGRWVELLY